MKILVLTPFLPYPTAQAGCPRAVFDRLHLLAAGHELTLVTFALPGERARQTAPIRRHVRLYMVPRQPVTARGGWPLWRKRLKLAAGLLRPARPMLVQEFSSPQAQRLIRGLLHRRTFDLILVEHILMAQYVMGLASSLPVILSEHDLRLALPAADARPRPGPRGWLAALDQRKWRRYETEACRRAAAVLVPTAEDAALFAKLVPGTRPQVVPFGLVTPDPPAPGAPAARDPATLLFVGNFSHPPNVDAVLWLCAEILPYVHARRPDVQLLIVGRDPTADVRALASPSVQVTGEVSSVAPYLARCTLFVAPLRTGGGLRMKLIEALRAAAPVVTTPLGAQGLGTQPGRDLLIAAGAADFAAAILLALADPARRAALSQAGQTLMMGQAADPARRADLEQILQRVQRTTA